MTTRNHCAVDATGVDDRVPAECVVASRSGQLPGADLRVYQFHSHRTIVPPLRDIAVIGWQSRAEISLRCGSIRGRTRMEPWDFSILSPGNESIWRWNASFQAVVFYLSEKRLADVAAEIFDRHVDTVQIRETFQLRDPVIRGGLAALAQEVGHEDAVGNTLYSDALVVQLCIHLLRRHSHTRLRDPRCPGGLSAHQARRVAEFIDGHLACALSLDVLSQIAGISRYHFARRFKLRFGVPPHAYVQQRRTERARRLLLGGDLAIKEIAFATGFCDQSHLTKAFRRFLHMTPAECRKSAEAH